MRAEFHLNGSLDVVVENEAGHIRLTKWEGACFEHHLGDQSCKERVEWPLLMDRSEARAIASALMGCAAKAD